MQSVNLFGLPQQEAYQRDSSRASKDLQNVINDLVQ